ncbi:MAG: hypothetical protein KGJ57_05720 [Sphingomonadales bacterium]|nr:hypothetical protein [Sphingomonadales bacterium]MDE2168916.1 hypothetical protein [Sphingomonadales bacterium]
MIIISFGMLKSASTLAYQMTEQILRQAGRAPCILGLPLRPALSVTNYFDNIDMALIRRIEAAAQGRDIVIKTHQLPAPDVLEQVEHGAIRATVSYRDPREIALSMVDHGARSRRWSIPEFSECKTASDCLASIDDQVETLRSWCRIGGVERIAYNDICFDMRSVITRLANRLGVAVMPAQVESVFANKMMVGQFNKGVKDRFHEMSARESTIFLDRYAHFYDEFMPRPSPSSQSFIPRAGSSQLRQILIGGWRLWHNRGKLLAPYARR